MSPREDPLGIKPAPPDRVFYATGALLDAQDFDDEQTYHRGRLARALAYLHGSGTLAGLKVDYEAPLAPGADPQFPAGREEQLMVRPGIAIDRLGRIIEVPASACIRLGIWYDGQPADKLVKALHPRTPPLANPPDPYSGVVVDLFIRFFVCEHGKTPAFAAGPFDALDAVAPSRRRDWYQLELLPRPEDRPRLPQSRWSDFTAIADADERGERMRQEIVSSWREGTDAWDSRGPRRMPEHVEGQDTTSLFLARLTLPAGPAPRAGARPARIVAQSVTVDDKDRPFVYPTDLLAQLLGLVQGRTLPEEPHA